MITAQRSAESALQQRRMKARQGRDRGDDVREIGPPPPIKDAMRREACSQSLREYLLTYKKPRYSIPFSPDHENLIAMTESALLLGGHIVCAMPRGSGKTTIFQDALEWAILNAHRQYGMLLCSDATRFKGLMDGLKSSLETNDLLYQDYPEICHPVRSVDRTPVRALYQTCEGLPTHMQWSASQIVLPTTSWSVERGNAGLVIGGGGLSGSTIRGAIYSRPNGDSIRPDAVLCDDPQTRKSARSASQNQEREDILKADVAGMAGPDANIAICVTCTVIYRDDLAERLLDRERTPEFKSVRVSMVKSWPSNMTLWEEYHEIRRQEYLEEVGPGTANSFYLEKQAEMDAGCAVYWDHRIRPGFSTAIESAMAKYMEDPRAFLSEYQNSPEETIDTNFVPLNSLQLVGRQSHLGRGRVPEDVQLLTAHIDVQQTLLYWMICGWTSKMGGYIIDFGWTPEQSRSNFTLLSIQKTLQKAYQDHDIDGSIRQGVADTITAISQTQFRREDGADLGVHLGLVDVRYKPTIVEEGILASGYQNNWRPAWGVGVGAKDTPLKIRFKGHAGDHWVVQRPKDRRLLGGFIDTNHWKSEVYTGLSVPPAHSHAIRFFKARSLSVLQMPADHFCAERATRVEANGRKIDEWDNWRRQDNHHFDNLVGNMVAASMSGISKESQVEQVQQQYDRGKRRIKYGKGASAW